MEKYGKLVPLNIISEVLVSWIGLDSYNGGKAHTVNSF